MEKNPHPPLANYTDLLLDAICLVDGEGRFVYASAACESIFGYSPREIVGRTVMEMVHPDDREKTRQAAEEVRSGGVKTHFENRYIRKDGQIVHIMWSARWSEVDQLRVAVARNITERKHAESMQHALYAISEAANATEDLQVLLQRVDGIVSEQLPAGGFAVALHDPAADTLSFPYYRGLAGETSGPAAPDSRSLSAEIVHTGEARFVRPGPEPAGDRRPWADVSNEAAFCMGVPLKSRSGSLGALLLQSRAGAVPYTDRDRELLQFVATQVVTAMERIRMQAGLRHMAMYDYLTGLPNRQLLNDRLATALARARRENQTLALLYIDLDNLKQVNDTLGHACGDHLLKLVSERIAQALRGTDTVARLGGDEFAVLLEGGATAENACELVVKIREILRQPVELAEGNVSIDASIGVALYPEHGSDERQLFMHADGAMYTEKRSKKQGADARSRSGRSN